MPDLLDELSAFETQLAPQPVPQPVPQPAPQLAPQHGPQPGRPSWPSGPSLLDDPEFKSFDDEMYEIQRAERRAYEQGLATEERERKQQAEADLFLRYSASKGSSRKSARKEFGKHFPDRTFDNKNFDRNARLFKQAREHVHFTEANKTDTLYQKATAMGLPGLIRQGSPMDPRDVPKEDRKDYLGILSEVAATEPVDPNLAQQVAERWRRGLGGVVRMVPRWLAASNIGSESFNEDIEFYDQAEAIRKGADPSAGVDLGEGPVAWTGEFLQRGALSAVEMTPAVLASRGAMRGGGKVASLAGAGKAGVESAGKAAGISYWSAQAMPGIKNDLIESGTNEDTAWWVALAASPLVGAIEYLQMSQIFGLKAAASIKRTAKQAILKYLTTFGTEVSEETLQAGVEVGAKAVATQLDSDTRFDGMQEAKKVWDATVSAVEVMPWLMGAGAIGAATAPKVPVDPDEAIQKYQQLRKRLEELEQLRTEEKQYVTKDEGKAHQFTDAEMKNRESRNRALDKRIQQTRQELEVEQEDEVGITETRQEVRDRIAKENQDSVRQDYVDRGWEIPDEKVRQEDEAQARDAEVQPPKAEPDVSQPTSIPDTYRAPAGSQNAPDEHKDMKRAGAGWKLHLTVTPENRAEVTQKLREKGLTFKEGRSGGQEGKNYTVYVGSKNKADRISQEIELELGNLLDTADMDSDAARDDQSFTEKVMGRFDAATDEFHQYGFGGLPALMSQVSSDMGKGMSTYDYDKVRRVLKKRFGEFFSGTQPPDVQVEPPEVQVTPPKEYGDANKIVTKSKYERDLETVRRAAQGEKKPTPPVTAAPTETPAKPKTPQKPIKENERTRKRAIASDLLDLDDNASDGQLKSVYRKHGYVDVDGFSVHPDVDSDYVRGLSEDTKQLLADHGILVIGSSKGGAEASAVGSAGGIMLGNRIIGAINVTADETTRNFTGKDQTVLHELGHHVYENELSESQRDEWNQRTRITQHGKDIEAETKRPYSKEQAPEEDFAEYYAENNADLNKTLQSKAAEQTGVPPVVDDVVQRNKEAKAKARQEETDWKRRTSKQGGRAADTTRSGFARSVNDAMKTLGVKPRHDLSPQGINAAYRLASTNAHPDRGGSYEAMARVNAAYELLKQSPYTLELAKLKWESLRKPSQTEGKPAEPAKSPFAYQDDNQERVIHDSGWKRGNAFRYVLEGAGDIFRELTKGKHTDWGYIKEKVRRARRQFEKEPQGPSEVHPDDKRQMSYENNKELFSKMIAQWESQPVENSTQELARQMNIAMLNGEFDKASSLIDKILIAETDVAEEKPAPQKKVAQPTKPMKEAIMARRDDGYVDGPSGVQNGLRTRELVDAQNILTEKGWKYAELLGKPKPVEVEEGAEPTTSRGGIVAYHGRRAVFPVSEFDVSAETSLLGKGIWFTDSESEAEAYSSIDPMVNFDVPGKIEFLAKELGVHYRDAKKLYVEGAEPNVLKVLLDFKNPMDLYPSTPITVGKRQFDLAAAEADVSLPANAYEKFIEKGNAKDQIEYLQRIKASQMVSRIASILNHDAIVFREGLAPKAKGTQYLILDKRALKAVPEAGPSDRQPGESLDNFRARWKREKAEQARGVLDAMAPDDLIAMRDDLIKKRTEGDKTGQMTGGYSQQIKRINDSLRDRGHEEPSDMDKGYMAYAQNAADVGADPTAATPEDLNRAQGFLDGQMRSNVRKAERGDITNAQRDELNRNIQSESDWYRRLEKEKLAKSTQEKPPPQKKVAKLTAPMKKAIISRRDDGYVDGPSGVQNGLRTRGLVDDKNELTEKGWEYAGLLGKPKPVEPPTAKPGQRQRQADEPDVKEVEKKPTPTHKVKISRAISPHEIASVPNDVQDLDKVNKMATEMGSDGWNGPPLLVFYDAEAENYDAFNGSHRVAAARRTGTDIPVRELDRSRIQDSADSLLMSLDDINDEDRVEILKHAGYLPESSMLKVELDQRDGIVTGETAAADEPVAKPTSRQELEEMNTDALRGMAPKGTKSLKKKGLIDAILEATVPVAEAEDMDSAALDALDAIMGEEQAKQGPTPGAIDVIESPGVKRKSEQTKEAAADDLKAAREAADKLMKKIRGKLLMGVDPELMADTVQVAYMYSKAGVKTFKGYVEEIVENFGDEFARKFAPYMEAGWGALHTRNVVEDPAGSVADFLGAEAEPQKRRGRKDQQGAIPAPGEQAGLPGMEEEVAAANVRDKKLREFRKTLIYDKLLEISEPESRDLSDKRFGDPAFADANMDILEGIRTEIEGRVASSEDFVWTDVAEDARKQQPVLLLPESVNEGTYDELVSGYIDDLLPTLTDSIKEVKNDSGTFKIGDAVIDNETGEDGVIEKFAYNDDGKAIATLESMRGRSQDEVLVEDLREQQAPLDEAFQTDTREEWDAEIKRRLRERMGDADYDNADIERQDGLDAIDRATSAGEDLGRDWYDIDAFRYFEEIAVEALPEPTEAEATTEVKTKEQQVDEILEEPKGVAPANAESIKALTPTLEKQVDNETSMRRKLLAAVSIIDGEAEQVQKALFNHLREYDPGVMDHAEANPDQVPIGMRKFLLDDTAIINQIERKGYHEEDGVKHKIVPGSDMVGGKGTWDIERTEDSKREVVARGFKTLEDAQKATAQRILNPPEDTKPITGVTHVVEYYDDKRNLISKRFTDLKKAQEYARKHVSSVETKVPPVKEKKVRKVVKYNKKSDSFDVSGLTNRQAQAVEDRLEKDTSYYGDENSPPKLLRKAVRERARETEPERPEQSELSKQLNEAERSFSELGGDARTLETTRQNLVESKTLAFSRSYGVPDSRRSRSAKKWKGEMANARRDAQDDAEVKELDAKIEAKKGEQEALKPELEKLRKQRAAERQQEISGEMLEPGTIIISNREGPQVAGRIEGWNTDKVEYDYTPGMFSPDSGTFRSTSYGAGTTGGSGNISHGAATGNFATLDDYQTFEAVQQQAQDAIEAMRTERSRKAEVAKQKAADESMRKRVTLTSPVKTTVARVLNNVMYVKGGIGDGNFVVMENAAPENLKKRDAEMKAKGKIRIDGGSPDNQVDPKGMLAAVGKNAKPLQFAGYVAAENDDSIHQAVLTDGSKTVAIDADFYNFFSKAGLEFAGNAKVFSQTAGIALRKGGKVVGAIMPLSGDTTSLKALQKVLGDTESPLPTKTIQNSITRALKARDVFDGKVNKKKFENAYASLRTHAAKLDIDVPSVGTDFNVDKYKAAGDAVSMAIGKKYGSHPTAELRSKRDAATSSLKKKSRQTGPTRKQPTEDTDKPKEYGDANKIVTKSEYEKDLETISRGLRGEKLLSSLIGFDPALLKPAVRIGIYHFEAGTRNFAAWAEKMANDLGHNINVYLPELWNQVRNRPDDSSPITEDEVQAMADKMAVETEETTAEGPTPPPVLESQTTGTKHAKTDELRDKTGLPERDPTVPETFQEWEDAARRDYPDAAARLLVIGRAEKDPISVGKKENAAIGQHITDLTNRLESGEDVLDELLRTIKASDIAGTEAGRDLVSRKVERYSDFSIAGIIKQSIDRVGEDPTAEQMAKYKKMADRIKELEAETADLQVKRVEDQIAKDIAEAKLKKEKEKPKRGTKRARLEENADKATSNFKDAWEEAMKAPGVTLTTGGLNPEAIASLAKLTKAAGGVIKAYAELGVDSFLGVLARAKNDIGDLSSDQVDVLKKAWDKYTLENTVTSPFGQSPIAAEQGERARELTTLAVEAGITERKDVINAVHEQLSKEVPGITRYQTMEAMTGYGDYRQLDNTGVKGIVRGIRGKVRQDLKIKDLKKAIDLSKQWLKEGMSPEAVAKKLRDDNLLPKKSGVQHPTPDSIERALIAEVNKLKKDLPVPVESGDDQLQAALTSAKTAANNRLELYDAEIAALEESIKEHTPLEKPTTERTPLRTDKDLDKLRDKLAERRQRRDKLKAEYDEIFPPSKTLRQKAADQQEQAAMKQIEKIQEKITQIQEGTRPARKGTTGKLVSKELLDKLTEARASLKAAKIAAREAEIAAWEGEGGSVLSSGKKRQTRAKRLERIGKALDGQIIALKGDLAAGRLDPTKQEKLPPVTSPETEAKQRELEDLIAVRELARQASPEYQAQVEAKRMADYKKALDKRQEFWEKRLQDAKQGKLPEKRKRTPVDNEILDKKIATDQVKMEAKAEIEAERRRRMNLGQNIWEGLLEVTSLLPRTLQSGLDKSVFFRQGFWYTHGHPLLAMANVVESIQAVFSDRIAFSKNADISKRDNAREYHVAGIQFTEASGPRSKMEEMYQSAIVRWLANTKGILWSPARFPAQAYMATERGFRTFANEMRADLYDTIKDDSMNIRDFFNKYNGLGEQATWTESDVKLTGNSANIFSGRGTGIPVGGFTNWLLWAPRWVWSNIQAEFIIPFQMVTPKFIGQWNADPAIRIAHAKLYARALLGAAAHTAALYWVMWILADDDDEKPTLKWNPLSSDLLSSDLWKLKVGETRIDVSGGKQQAIVLAARVLSAIKWNLFSSDSISSDTDVKRGRDAWDLMTKQLRYKLGPAPSGLVDFFTGFTAVEEELPENWLLRAGDIALRKMHPMAWGDVFEAEKALGWKQGTVASIEAIFGASGGTYGPTTEYRESDEAGRKKMTEDYLLNMDWDSGLPAFSKYLTEEQIQQVRWRQEERMGLLIFNALAPVPDLDEYKRRNDLRFPQKSYDQAVKSRENALAEFEDLKLKYAPTFDDAKRLFKYKFTRDYTRDGGKAKGGLRKKGTGTLLPSYDERLPRLRAIYRDKTRENE